MPRRLLQDESDVYCAGGCPLRRPQRGRYAIQTMGGYALPIR